MRIPALVVVLLAAACTSLESSGPEGLATAQVAPDFESYQVRRVGLLPFVGADVDRASAQLLQQSFYAEVSQSTPFEIVLLDATHLAEIPASQPYTRGWYDPRTILELARRFRLDGLLVGTVMQMQTFPPQKLSLALELVSAETGLVLWTSTVHLDAADKRVSESMRAYLKHHRASDGTYDNLTLGLLSPSSFARFAAWQVAQLL